MKQKIGELNEVNTVATYFIPTAQLIQQASSRPTLCSIDHAHSNNAFANLRNQITNLKLQFSKLVQKDAAGQGEFYKSRKQSNEQREIFGDRRDNRISSLYQMQGRQVFKKSNHSNGFFHFGGKNPFGVKVQNQNQNGLLQRKDDRIRGQLTGESLKLMGSGVIEGKDNDISTLSQTKVFQQQRMHALSQKVYYKENQFKSQLQETREEVSRWKQASEKANLALSLKNNLIDKLQQSLESKQQEKIHLETQSQTRYQALSDQYNKCQHELSLLKKQFEEQISSLQQQNSYLKQASDQSASQIAHLQHEIQQLREQNKNILHSKPFILGRNEQIQLLDLRKRVEAYQRSIEHLNSANTATREKLAQAQLELNQVRQQLRRVQAKGQSLFEENSIKQSLITSLYRDISILDKQIRQIPVLKATLALSQKSIDSLNETIIQLQCEKHNYRYSHIFQQ